MTRNILIATIFSLATALLLGYIFIFETRRIPVASAAISAEQLERGARDYEQYCATCHGLAGQGNANEVGAPAINNIAQRYFQNENGQVLFEQQYGVQEKYGTLRNYIEATLYSGIRGAAMPAFGAQGTLRQDQIENITSYVLSWNGNVPPAAATTAAQVADDLRPTADPNANAIDAAGQVFARNGCTGCHLMNDQKLVGPGLGGLFQPDGTAAFGTVLPNNKPVDEANVVEWIRGGTAGFPENIDPVDGQDYGAMPGFPNINDEDMQQIIVWLQSHNRDGSLTEEAQQIQQETAAQPGSGEGQEGPTAQPTGQPNQPGAPNTEAGPGSTATP